ncbi:MAG: WbqC family protein [Lachnospiraceae bacterium]|nr:WbqC family protein [Lachnospiraceae bacterium]
MTLGIMQPYLFPYLGYFSIVENVDRFVFFDTPQYIRKGWINRNRILSSNNEAIFFTVPVRKAERSTQIKEVCINNQTNWPKKITGQLGRYSKAPYYDAVFERVSSVINNKKIQSICDMAIQSIRVCSDYIGIDTKFDIFSRMDMNLPKVNSPDEWALYITKAAGGDAYINPPGGESFFDRKKYEREGIKLSFLKQVFTEYQQFGNVFLPGLSIIDVMMFNSPGEIKKMLHNYELIF